MAAPVMQMNAMAPAGPQAARIADMTWLLTGVASAVFAVVIGLLLFGVWRARRREEALGGAAVERKLVLWVGGGVGITTVILLMLLVANLQTGRALAAFAEPEALTVRVVGQQWWWQLEYRDPSPSRRLQTANEMYIPVGRRIRVEVESRDVIHSFWAPELHGKIDLIPGYSSTTYLEADEPGVYRARCAEFCGLQHAHMDMLVIAVPAQEFDAWYERQLAPAPQPKDSLELAGREVFEAKSCVLCHAVRGTDAGSHVGPDLTHVASRRTLAAGTIPNRRGHLAGWIVDPQRIKPGVLMPPNALEPDELHALLAYLESLK